MVGTPSSGLPPLPAADRPGLPVLSRADPAWPTTLVQTSLAALTPDGGTIEIAMNPGTLGTLRITLTLEGDAARVAIRTETAEAAQLLTEAAPDLARDFALGGVTLEALDSQPAPSPTPQDDQHGDAASARDGQRPPPWASAPYGAEDAAPDTTEPAAPYQTLSRPLPGLLNLIA
jgi:flagellar hook-length control protein FliK